MRLLDVYDLEFGDFPGHHVPRYTITSHRWCSDEASFKDISKKRYRPSEGLKKLEGFCKFVRDDNNRKAAIGRQDEICKWIWLDTVCIKKEADAEVTESINSMFHWYWRAEVCYAYLVDVRPLSAGREAVMSDFKKSNWFTRGWTLQELIAPRQVIFLTSAWEILGMTRAHAANGEIEDLGSLVAEMTGIPKYVFGDRGRFHLDSISPANRSKWMQRRETTKIEDIAYCLLGILDVTMPLVYGERGNAWQRLEDEVSKKYKTTISLPKPDALNKRNSGQDFRFWFQQLPSRANEGEPRASDSTKPTNATTVVQPQTPPRRKEPPNSPALIPSYHPDKLGESLLKAAADGEETNLRLLLGRGALHYYRDRSGFTALHHAALHGHDAVTEQLTKAGADVNAQSLEMGTPLCLAAIRAKPAMVRLLLDKGADVNEAGRWTGTPLHCASWSGCTHSVTTLLDHGADIRATNTIWAEFLEHGSNLGCEVETDTGTMERQNSESCHQIFDCQPIVIAAHRRQERVVQLLLERRFPGNMEHRFWWSQRPDKTSFEDVSEDDRCDKETVLMAASWKGPRTVLLKLLSVGVAVNARDSWGRSALWIAAQSAQLENVKALVEAGANVNSPSNSGKSPLRVAIESGNVQIVDHLIQKGADVDRVDQNGRTACHFAAFRGKVEILELLLKGSARYSARDKDGRTPLHTALTGSDHVPAVECLLNHGANTLDPDNDGRTPLHYAANRGSPAVMLLLDAGADTSIEDSSGRRASSYLPTTAPILIRQRLMPRPSADAIPRCLRRDSGIKIKVDMHGCSLSDSSNDTLGKASRKNSRELPAIDAMDVSNETITPRSGSV